MADVTVGRSELVVRFGGFERRWVGRRELRVPLAAVRGAAVETAPLALAQGTRRGLDVTGVAKIGIWGLVRGPRRLVSARRGVPALHVFLDRGAADVDELLVSTVDAAALAAALVPGRAVA